VSVDGYISSRDPSAGRGLGDGSMLFDWYTDGDTPSPGRQDPRSSRVPQWTTSGSINPTRAFAANAEVPRMLAGTAGS
jgi:hypothetical protein